MKKQITKIIGTWTLAIAAFVFLSGVEAYGLSYNKDYNVLFDPTETTSMDVDGDGNYESVYLWNTDNNWTGSETGSSEEAGVVRISAGTGARRVVVASNPLSFDNDLSINYDNQDDNSDLNGDGELDILSGATFTTTRSVCVAKGHEGSEPSGAINLRGGTHKHTGFHEIRIGEEGGKGAYNIYDGTLDTESRIRVGAAGGSATSGEMNIYGGQVSIGKDLQIAANPFNEKTGMSGVFNVAGSGSGSISVGGNWVQAPDGYGTLKVGIDDGGVTPIDISGDVTFNTNSLLDVGFLEGAKRRGTWDVMTWGGKLDDSGLKLSPESNDDWKFYFVDTDNSGSADTLRVSIPHPEVFKSVPGDDSASTGDDDGSTGEDTGSVDYSFRITRGEVPVEDYVKFLNAAESANDIAIEEGEVYSAVNGERYCLTAQAEDNSYITYDADQTVGQRFTYVSDRHNHPMIFVSWFGAAAYCNWKSSEDGRTPVYQPGSGWTADMTADGYRLPTEKEWYKAAAWNPEQGEYTAYGTGEDEVSGEDVNYLHSGDDSENNSVSTTPVLNNFPDKKSYYEMYDASGNVWEWCHGFFSENGEDEDVDPHAVRGGSWGNDAESCRVANRDDSDPGYSYIINGFRFSQDL